MLNEFANFSIFRNIIIYSIHTMKEKLYPDIFSRILSKLDLFTFERKVRTSRRIIIITELVAFALFVQNCAMLDMYLYIEYRVTCFTRVLKKIDRCLCERYTCITCTCITLSFLAREGKWCSCIYVHTFSMEHCLPRHCILSTLTWFWM